MRRCWIVSYLYLLVLMRNNDFSSHRAAREITPTWLIICRADLGVHEIHEWALRNIFLAFTCTYVMSTTSSGNK